MYDILNEDKIQTRKEEREKRRLKILSDALDVFLQKGYSAAKIQDIAHASDMHIDSVKHYFESKEKIFDELVNIIMVLQKALFKNTEAEPLEFFRLSVMDMTRYIEKYPFFAKMILFMPRVYDSDSLLVTEKREMPGIEIAAIFLEKIKQGQSNGTIKEGEPLSLVVAFFGAIHGILALSSTIPVLSTRENPISFSFPDSEWIVDIIKK